MNPTNENPARGCVNAAIIELVCSALFVGGLMALTGCSATTRNNGEWSFFFGTQIGLRQNSAKTSQDPADDGAATIELHSQPLEDWWASERTQTSSVTTMPPIGQSRPVTP